MHNVKMLGALLLLAAAAPAAPAAAQHVDPTTEVQGSGLLPGDWMIRFDPPAPANAAGAALKAIRFEDTGKELRIASGPAAIYYNTKDIGKGQFAVSATFTQNKDLGHEVAGIFIGGSDLQSSTQNYIYFVVRAQDGMGMISHRSSDKAPKALRPYFANAAFRKQDATGRATNALTIHVAADTVHFVANGKLVAAIAKTDLDGGKTDGQVGLRVNHNMDLAITGYKLSN
jgi:hypothetical protein